MFGISLEANGSTNAINDFSREFRAWQQRSSQRRLSAISFRKYFYFISLDFSVEVQSKLGEKCSVRLYIYILYRCVQPEPKIEWNPLHTFTHSVRIATANLAEMRVSKLFHVWRFFFLFFRFARILSHRNLYSLLCPCISHLIWTRIKVNAYDFWTWRIFVDKWNRTQFIVNLARWCLSGKFADYFHHISISRQGNKIESYNFVFSKLAKNKICAKAPKKETVVWVCRITLT